MKLGRPGRWLVSLAIVVAVAVSVGGGSTFVALEVTTDPKFCTTCHIMEPYYESWATSTHNNVPCVECHYEPGLLETFEGKFKALSQLAKYVTRTEGSKPWAEVSDNSCMRSGCHSSRLLEGPIKFGRINFDHRHHLVGLRRGKKLRCTSCHSQIVQGNHLTVTPTTCFLCHFKQGEETKPIDDCNLCHGPPSEDIELGDFTFRHADYLERGVQCDSCHGDVIRGNGEVPRERCGSCHNKQEHLERIGDVDFIHRKHVTDHSVTCLDCHMEIQHGLPPREQHYEGACTDCHEDTHGSVENVYRGTGAADVPDQPGVMYLARVTCNGCHRPPFPDAPVPKGGDTFEADPLACLDCHGPGYEGMAERWQAETDGTLAQLQAGLGKLHELLQEPPEERDEDADPARARTFYDSAASNLGLVMLDGSRGVHNLPYARAVLSRAADDMASGFDALGEARKTPEVAVGPEIASKSGCTNLCHVGVDQAVKVDHLGELPFPHATHLVEGRLDCTTCHAEQPHGTTRVTRADCASCHHSADDSDACAACHTQVGELRAAETEGEPSPMWDFDCLTCHEGLSEGFSEAQVKANCDFCHEDMEEGFVARRFEPWQQEGSEPLQAVLDRVDGMTGELAERVRERARSLLAAGPFHNIEYAREEAARLQAELDAATGRAAEQADGVDQAGEGEQTGDGDQDQDDG